MIEYIKCLLNNNEAPGGMILWIVLDDAETPTTFNAIFLYDASPPGILMHPRLFEPIENRTTIDRSCPSWIIEKRRQTLEIYIKIPAIDCVEVEYGLGEGCIQAPCLSTEDLKL